MKRIYVCGPTVYSKVHIGNMKPIITFDIFNRSLRYLKEDVFFIHNITDIDDKIVNKAIEQKKSEQEISQHFYQFYLKMLEKYNVIKPNDMPLVTDNMDMIIELIDSLVKNKNAYESNGNVYFDIKSIDNYGIISNNSIDNLESENNLNKKNKEDFALWKNTSKGIQFNSPWGKGRPGWHTECTAFILNSFNKKQLDIHGGGIDLLFPHHENENAQFYALTKKQIAKEFVHTGLLNIQGEKMAKSVGNIINADDFANQHGIDTFRMIILNSSITRPINITDEVIKNAQSLIKRFEVIYKNAKMKKNENGTKSEKINEIATLISKWDFSEAMKLVHENISNSKSFKDDLNYNYNIVQMFDLLGFSFTNISVTQEDKDLILEWKSLRKNNDFEAADKLRDILIKKRLI